MPLRSLLLCTTLLSAALPACGAQAAPAPLRLCYEDVPARPWTMPDGSGLSFELLKRVERQLDEHFSYLPKPWRRCLEELRTGSVDAIIGAAYTSERSAYGVYPTLPGGRDDPARAMYDDAADVFLRAGSNARWDGQRLSVPNKEVAVQSGYMIAGLVRQAGLHPREQVKSAEDGLRLLASGMVDAAILQGPEPRLLAREDARFRQRVIHAPGHYVSLPLYLVVARGAYGRSPQRIEAIWRAIAAVRTAPDYRQQLAAAGVAP